MKLQLPIPTFTLAQCQVLTQPFFRDNVMKAKRNAVRVCYRLFSLLHNMHYILKYNSDVDNAATTLFTQVDFPAKWACDLHILMVTLGRSVVSVLILHVATHFVTPYPHFFSFFGTTSLTSLCRFSAYSLHYNNKHMLSFLLVSETNCKHRNTTTQWLDCIRIKNLHAKRYTCLWPWCLPENLDTINVYHSFLRGLSFCLHSSQVQLSLPRPLFSTFLLLCWRCCVTFSLTIAFVHISFTIRISVDVTVHVYKCSYRNF